MYTIIILDKIPWIYEDMALMITENLLKQKIPFIIYIFSSTEIYKEKDSIIKGTPIYMGHLIPEISINPGSIICDFDPIDFDMISNLTPQVLRENKIMCYSKRVIDNLKTKYPYMNIVKFDYGYSKYLDITQEECQKYYKSDFPDIPEREKPIDVTFLIGNYVYPRRNRIIQMLISCGLNVYHDNHTHRKDRMEIYSKSKIILSVYSKEINFEYSSGSRIFPAVSSGCFVISEKCTDPEEDEILQKVCVNVEYSKLVTTVLYYIKNVEQRIQLGKKFYENVKKYNTVI